MDTLKAQYSMEVQERARQSLINIEDMLSSFDNCDELVNILSGYALSIYGERYSLFNYSSMLNYLELKLRDVPVDERPAFIMTLGL